VRIFVNGEPREVAAGCSVAELLEALGLGAAPVAVERNQRLVPRAEHAGTRLAPEDRIELVTLVGGG